MSLWKVAWRSIQQRALASALTAVSMALGVSLVVAVLVIYKVVEKSFHRGGEGYDLIVGAKGGGRLELVLASVYYIGQPQENIPYSYYKELREGRLSEFVDLAIPICLGDNYEGYRVVATTPEMLGELKQMGDQPYQFAEGGRNFEPDAYFEAVVGATVARKTGLGVGDTFRPTHDIAGQEQHKHRPFTVVGVLEPTGTPNDQALFINIEGFYRIGGHTAAKGEAHHDEDDDEHEHEHAAVPEERKGVTAVLVRTDEHKGAMVTDHLAREINGDKLAQAAIPAKEIALLFEKIIGDIEMVLLWFGIMIVLVAGIGIMVSIYNSMSDRRHEIAIMRSLGASRGTIMLVILMESILLSLGGGLLGLALGHGLIAALGPTIAAKTGFSMGLLQFRGAELILIPGLILLASAVGYLPAVAAYRTDVSKSLGANP
ncbi:MAG: FtsX-like permease family protein [Thermoguttaceae bacterium]